MFEKKLQNQKNKRVLKRNLENVVIETLKLLLNSGGNNNAVPFFLNNAAKKRSSTLQPGEICPITE